MQLPEAFISQTKTLLGKEWDAFEQSLHQERPTSVRLNPQKTDNDFLRQTVFEVESPVAWASNAYYLRSRPVFTLDPLFHAGCYYVQEASSMFLEHFIKSYVRKPVIALDLCAAPGGKSTHLSAILPEGSLLVANEAIRSRANILSENLIKWGNPQTVVTNNYPANIGRLEAFFDVIVCDLPCSGEGMFRKDPGAITEWSVRNVKLCAERQRQIISDIFPALKPGGILIYSTCTYNREENEDNIDRICREFEAELLEEPRRFMPHKTKGEGFFIAALRKGNEMECSSVIADLTHNPKTIGNHPFFQWLSKPGDYAFFSENNTFFAFPVNHYKAYLFLKKSLRIVSTGVILGKIKGKDLIPNHALAMSTALSEKAFPRWDLDRETALKYLRKEALQNIPAEIPPGFVIVAYHNQPLGFIKNIGTRANNLYPQEWRIRI
ncbi:MAG: RsmB/NOP family class I SAM-dependent RNA methyltransferase [Dysgonamonadaceae bacterium]|jgi:16S rRNA C967 or C1407 C5-methylase (RsmB/RsmF family)/NOL1/NOP2/fmu family ribosome biogenesis protein|nr:RsmB/NOP family class I SAM-dependent RNA methyltransferase [Dysgonamonadaceae bacterium]